MTHTTPLVFITGGSSGIGQALAQHYLDAGWRVALVARRAHDMAAWAKSFNQDTLRVGVYGADVSIAQQARSAALAWMRGWW